jgi:hypothetical protein
MIVGVSGYATAGKDSAADVLVAKAGFVKRSFADGLREVAYASDPIVGFKRRWLVLTKPIHWQEAFHEIGYHEMKLAYPEVRRFLQLMGTEAGREILGDNVWVNAAMGSIAPGDDVVFADMRFPNEALAVERTRGITIRVDRPGVEAINAHESETALDDWPFDYRISNDSTLEALGGAIMEVIANHRK